MFNSTYLVSLNTFSFSGRFTNKEFSILKIIDCLLNAHSQEGSNAITAYINSCSAAKKQNMKDLLTNERDNCVDPQHYSAFTMLILYFVVIPNTPTHFGTF